MAKETAEFNLIFWLMALTNTEIELCRNNPKLYRELFFQAMALVLCVSSIGFAVYNVTVHLLGYQPLAAVVFGAAAAFSLFLIDHHLLIQGRGAYQNMRGRIIKVRSVSMMVIVMSFLLLSTSTFEADIEGVIAAETAKNVQELTNSPRYQPELKAAQDEIRLATKMVERRDTLRQEVTDLTAQAAQARRDERDQCEGNATVTPAGIVTRVPQCGPLARGHATEAARLEREMQTKQGELTSIGDPQTRLSNAQSRLTTIESAIQAEAAAGGQGASKKLDALFDLLSTKPSAVIAMVFWAAVGLVPDLLMFMAQARMFNEEAFAGARRVQDRATEALTERQRLELRRRNADGLAPIEVRLETPPRLVTADAKTPAANHERRLPTPPNVPDQEAA